MQQNRGPCADTDNGIPPKPSLPSYARLPFNRCNLPAVILGSLTFQRHPAPLYIDGVMELHKRFFAALEACSAASERARLFHDHMAAHFLLEHLDEAGLDSEHGRGRLDYRRLLRGWFFDAEGREAAVIKGWVESRFGLLTRFHREPIPSHDSENYQHFLEARRQGSYNTNAIETQLDLLYAYGQFELAQQKAEHVVLYRGVNDFAHHEVLAQTGKKEFVLLLNNVSSFTANSERAGEFGDLVLRTRVPLSKVLFSTPLLPGLLAGEDEYLVIGGVYEVEKL